jgi:hypothetical protein
MKIRRAVVNDKEAVCFLYREMAGTSGGIARVEEEITESNIESLFESVSKGMRPGRHK